MERRHVRRPDDEPATKAEGTAAVKSPSESGSSPASDSLPSDSSPTLFEPISDAPTIAEGTFAASAGTSHPSDLNNQTLLRPGTVLARRYEILQILGEGGMGAVYRARDREVNRTVALKVIRPELTGNSAILDRFKQELVLSHQVTHKNVVRIYDMGDADGIKFITMEYIEGQDLRSLIAEQKVFQPEEAVEIMRQVCRALEAAHAVGVIHRDLKPQNIMRDKQGRVVVMDFGLARLLDSHDGMTQTGAIVGTMEYMSPEQGLGKPLDERSDLFAVGLIFYELLTGKMPYKADSALASLVKRTHERAVPVSEESASIPHALSDIVGKCLEPKLPDRYQHVGEILTDLEAWQGGRAAATLRFPTGARPWGQSRLPWRWIGAACAIVVLASVGYLLRHKMVPAYTTAGKPVSVLLADFKNTTGDPVFDGTLEPVFSTALEAAPFVNTYKRGSAHRIATQVQPAAKSMDESVARLVAVREGIEVVISGAIGRDGEGYRISARAVDANTGKQIAARELMVPNRDAVLAAIGKLATPIRNQLGDTTPESAQLAAEESFTTSSLDAAHSYSMAQDAVEHGQLEQAIQHYQKAVQFDPNLGRAWAGLAVASVNLKKMSDAGEYYKKTLSLLDRMSERERYRTLGTYYAAFLHNYPQAVETYQKLVFLYPGDTAARNNLSIAYVFTLDFPKAIEAVRHAVESNPHNLQWRLNYALYSMYAGDFATAAAESQRIIQENPSYQFAYLPLAISTLARGDADGARAIYTRFEKVSPDAFSVAKTGEADLEMYYGHYKKAIDVLKLGIQADEKDKNTGEMALKYVAEAEAYLALGQKAEAIQAAQKAVHANSDESVAYPAARVFIQAGDDAEARKIASALDNTLQTQSRSYSQLIAGEIDIQHHRLPQAVEELRQGQKLHDSWISHFLLGQAYLGAGHNPEALAEFETCKKRLGETADMMFADSATLRYLPPLYYWLARTQSAVGMTSVARESYQQFLKLRVEADPGDSLVEEAKKSAGGMSQ
jgi:tetratricopeptide (TPR) repeat protein/predicted Ser/Thr protein kinase